MTKPIPTSSINEDLISVIEESLTTMGGNDESYTEFISFLNKHKMLSRPKRLFTGQMLFFKYLPTNERFIKSGKYYDMYPLILITDSYRGGFEGINLHYLDPETRSLLFDNMIKNFPLIGTDGRLPRINLNYNALSSRRPLRMFKPCYKKYRWDGIQKQPISVPFVFWKTIVEQDLGFFRKKRKANIYLESWSIIRKPPTTKGS